MSDYSVNLVGTNSYLMPMNRVWKLQMEIVERDLDADEWEFVDPDGFREDATQLKQELDNREIDYPCGEMDLSNPEAYSWKTERTEVAEVSVTATCKQCGWEFSGSEHISLEK